MSQAEELLANVTDENIAAYTSEPTTEPHIVIGKDRIITVPDELKRIAVQFDHNIETVTFDCPRYWDGHDMSTMKIYINYKRSDSVLGCFIAENIAIDEADETIMHFTWTITSQVSRASGNLIFLVCIKVADENGDESIHWNTEINDEMFVSKGLETGEAILGAYPDVLAQFEAKNDAIMESIKSELLQLKTDLINARDAGELNGATFTPHVSANGDLSWTNDKGFPNPETVNLQKLSSIDLVQIGDTEPTNNPVLWFDTNK